MNCNTPNINEIVEFIENFEKIHNINIFFVCESASRSHGIDVEDSDFDLKGFYLPHPSDSRKVIPKIPPCYKLAHEKVIIEGKEYDLDLEFLDLRDFGIKKVKEGKLDLDFIFYSPVIYINKFPNLIEMIKSKTKPSADLFFHKFNSLHQTSSDSITKSGKCLNKQLLTALVCGIQFFHVSYFGNFPTYNVWDEILFLKQEIRNLNLDEEKLLLLERIFELIKFYYEEKKNEGRKSTSLCITNYQNKFFEWMSIIFRNYRKNKKIKENNFELIFFEELSAEILASWLNLDLGNKKEIENELDL